MPRCRRTTLTLDDDVAATLEKLRNGRDGSFKELVNDALRRGLKQMVGRPQRRKKYQTRTVSLGRCRLGNLDNVSEALAIAEGDAFK